MFFAKKIENYTDPKLFTLSLDDKYKNKILNLISLRFPAFQSGKIYANKVITQLKSKDVEQKYFRPDLNQLGAAHFYLTYHFPTNTLKC